MTTATQTASRWSAPPGVWMSVVAIVGFAWNLFGALQFVRSVTATEEGLGAAGMSPEQIAVMTGFPAWVGIVFGIGALTSLVGCVLLFLRHRLAAAILGVSALAFALLWVAYAIYGAFAAFGAPQVAIMTTVVAVAIGLYAASRRIPTAAHS
jgi:hypothetical protein